MPNIRNNRRLITRRRGSSLDSSTTAWVNAVVGAGGTVSASRQTIINTLITSLKAHNLWNVHDRIWLLAAENSQSALIDLVNLSSATNNGSTFTVDQGYAGNGTTSFVNTNFGPSTNGVNYTQNSASLSCYVRTSRSTASNKEAVGMFDDGSGRSARFFPHANGSVVVASLNASNSFAQTGPTTNAQGFYTVSRTGATTSNTYKNSNTSSIFSDSTASLAGLSATTFYIGAENVQVGADNWFSDDQIAVVAFGAGLSSTDAAQFQTDINAYMTSLGTNVY